MLLEIIFGEINRFARKIALFDLDDTLIKYNPKSGRNYEYLYEEVKPKLKQLYKDDYLIGITTNQNAITTDSALNTFKDKITSLLEDLNIPIIFLSSIGNSPYRKPSIGMVCKFLRKINSTKNLVKNSVFLINNGVSNEQILNGIKNIRLDYSDRTEIDIKNIIKNNFIDAIYVGDGAGRKEDFSSADIKLAYNCGLKFYLPENFFKNEDVNVNISSFNIRNCNGNFEVDDYEIVFIYSSKMFGGKRYFLKQYFPEFKIYSGEINNKIAFLNCDKIEIINLVKEKNYKIGIFYLDYGEEVNNYLKFLANSTGETSSGSKQITLKFLKKLDNVINVPFIFNDKNFSKIKKEISKLKL